MALMKNTLPIKLCTLKTKKVNMCSHICNGIILLGGYEFSVLGVSLSIEL